jgi:hypothetical protein
MALKQTYQDCIQALDKIPGRMFEEEEMEAVEATFGTNKAPIVVQMLLDYAVACVVAESSCKSRRQITKKTHPKKKDREEAEKEAERIHADDETKCDDLYFELKKELMGEEEFNRLQKRQNDLAEAWYRASNQGLV